MQEIKLAPARPRTTWGSLIADALRCERGARRAARAAGAREDRRQSVLRHPVPLRARRRGAARLRSRRGALVLGPRAHPRQGLHRQRRGPHGREAEPPAAATRRRRCGSSPASATSPRSRRSRSFCGTSEEQVHAALWEAVRAGADRAARRLLQFVHDRVQEAAYALIPEESAPTRICGSAGCSRRTRPPEKREEAIFEIVNQLNRGAALITVAGGARAAGRAEPDRGQARQGRNGLCRGADLFHRRPRCCAEDGGSACTGSPSSSSSTGPSANS